MTLAETRKSLIQHATNILVEIEELDLTDSLDANVPLDGDEIEIITKKLYRVIQTLKTAQSLPLH